MKKIYSFIIAVVLCISTFTTSFADSNKERVLDNANLMEDSEEQLLEEKIITIAEEYNFDVVIVTVDGCEGKTPEAFADDEFDYGGYGFGENKDGLLFLISMEERDWYISTHGYGIQAFTDYGIQAIGEDMVGDLGNADYYEAFNTLLSEIPYYLDKANEGTPVDSYNTENTTENSDSSSFPFVAVLGISFAIALVCVLIMKSQMKTAKPQKMAIEYVNKDSFKITSRQDIYLYSNVTKTKKPTDNNSGGGSSIHTSSSGSSHGGGGGKF